MFRLWLLGFAAFTLYALWPAFPLLLAFAGWADGMNEGNSAIAVVPWLLFYTVPRGILYLIAWTIGCILGQLFTSH